MILNPTWEVLRDDESHVGAIRIVPPNDEVVFFSDDDAAFSLEEFLEISAMIQEVVNQQQERGE